MVGVCVRARVHGKGQKNKSLVIRKRIELSGLNSLC